MIEVQQVPVDGYLAGTAPAMLIDPARQRGSWRAELVPALRRALLMTCRGWIRAYLDDFHAFELDRAANDRHAVPASRGEIYPPIRLADLSISMARPQVRTEQGNGTGIGIPNVVQFKPAKSAEGERDGER